MDRRGRASGRVRTTLKFVAFFLAMIVFWLVYGHWPRPQRAGSDLSDMESFRAVAEERE